MGTGHRHVALKVGSRALGAFEPRQVRKEAALRTPSQVPRLRPIRAGGAGTSAGHRLDDGARGRALATSRARGRSDATRRGGLNETRAPTRLRELHAGRLVAP